VRLSRGAVASSLLLAGSVLLPGSASAQAGNPIVSSAVSEDSIRIGAIFRIDFQVSLAAAGEVRFPAVLPLPESLEQREAVEIDSRNGRTEWHASYALAAWSADSLAILPIAAIVAPDGAEEFEITIVAPSAPVLSVLPADGADLALRDARPFLRIRGFPWWILILVAALAAAAWWMWRRQQPTPAFVPTGPGHRALHELGQLREDWESGGLSLGQFFDRYELALRRYARATRSWAPYKTLGGLVRRGDLFTALRRSLFVRYAHVRARDGAPEEALAAGESFVAGEMEPDPELEPAPGPRPVGSTAGAES